MRGTDSKARRVISTLALAALWLAAGRVVRAQFPTSEERLKILTDPESLKKRVEKEKSRPPIEVFRSQVAPFDILPYVKPNHWSTLSLELRANDTDYTGFLQSAPVRLLGLPQEIIYRRDARLARGQLARLSQQVMLPQVPKELTLDLIQPDAIRPDEGWPASLRVLEPHQMLILFLTKESNDAYAAWNRFQAFYPHTAERIDLKELEEKRYYRLVLPLEPERPPLSSHPLTWTTLSHVVWDGMAPETLSPSQQQAMLDWLHWGGQLVLVGGAGPGQAQLKDSFLGPYLPADPNGESALLGRDALRPLAQAYRPPYVPAGLGPDWSDGSTRPGTYLAPIPIKPAPDRPVFFAGLTPKEGASTVSLGESGGPTIAVERRVGRGRVQMLAFHPNDPAIVSWPGFDTLLRRVILRRPEEGRDAREGRGPRPQRFGPLPGADLSWVRYLSRDMTSPPGDPHAVRPGRREESLASSAYRVIGDDEDEAVRQSGPSVAEWSDTSALPRLCRDALEEASGIKVPGSWFVLKVVLAYVLAAVPLNWLVCRYVLGRRELAWVVLPILSLAFAVGIERASAYDMGYNSACDEIDVVEAYGGYPRAHVSRFASLYSTGRTRFTVSYPADPSGLALPLDNGRSLRGEDVGTSVFQSSPVPALEGFLVQPRSLGMFRAEQMVTLDGAVSLEAAEGGRTLKNGSGFELRDAVLVDVSGGNDRTETYLGTVAPGESRTVRGVPRQGGGAEGPPGLRPEPFLSQFRDDYDDRPENQGEIRLVAWTPGLRGGQKIEPAVDRHRGFTAVVVHLRNGPPPAPDGPVYDATRKAEASPPPSEPRKAVAPRGRVRNVRRAR